VVLSSSNDAPLVNVASNPPTVGLSSVRLGWEICALKFWVVTMRRLGLAPVLTSPGTPTSWDALE